MHASSSYLVEIFIVNSWHIKLNNRGLKEEGPILFRLNSLNCKVQRDLNFPFVVILLMIGRWVEGNRTSFVAEQEM